MLKISFLGQLLSIGAAMGLEIEKISFPGLLLAISAARSWKYSK